MINDESKIEFKIVKLKWSSKVEANTVLPKEQISKPFISINHIADYVTVLKFYYEYKLPGMTKVSWTCSKVPESFLSLTF